MSLIRTISQEDVPNVWLQPRDYQAIRDNNRNTLFAVKKVNGDVSGLSVDQVCIRGLEKLISVVMFKGSRYAQRDFARNIVLQHKLERELGVSDPDNLRSLSVALSKADMTRALTIARIDASFDGRIKV